MYTSSEDAMHDNRSISEAVAAAELKRHGCRIIATCEATTPRTITVTNDIDEPEAIPCTTRAILEWLGY